MTKSVSWVSALLWICTACVAAPDAPEPDTDLPTIALEAGPCAVEPEEPHAYRLPVWDLTVSQDNWDRLHADVKAEVEVTANVCVGGQPYAIELELQGSSTRKLPKKSFDIKFASAHPLETWPFSDPQPTAAAPVHKVLLKAMAKDQTLVREALSFDLYRALGYVAPRTGFVNLRINGRYWGVYTAVEPVNDAFVASRGLPTPGRLYKGVRKYGSLADFAPGRDVKRAFELKVVDALPLPAAQDTDDATQEAAEESEPLLAAPLPAYVDLEAFVSLLQTTPLEPSAFTRAIDPVFPLAAYLDRMLWVAFTQNGDAVTQNFYLYVNQGRWSQLPWDSDISLGADWRDPEAWMTPQDALLLDGSNYFSQRLLKVPGLKGQYRQRFLAVLDSGVLVRVGFQQLEQYQALVAADFVLDAARWQRAAEPHSVFARLSEFLSARSSALRDALLSL